MKKNALAKSWSSLDTTWKLVLGITLTLFILKTLARRFG